MSDILPPSLANTDPDDDAGIPTEALSRGREWSEALVLSEIRSYIAQSVLCAYEAGRRLLWARRELGPRFEAWAEESVPASRMTRWRMMQLGAFFTRHPKLLGQLEGTSVKKVLLLASLPEEDVRAMADGVAVSGVTLADVATVPYATLKKQVDTATAAKTKAEERLVGLEKKTSEYADRIATLTGPVRPPEEAERRRELGRVEAELRLAFAQFHQVVDHLAVLHRDDLEAEAVGSRDRHLSAELTQDLLLAVEGAEVLGAHAKQKYRKLVGEMTADAEYADIVARVNGLPGDHGPLGATVLPFVDDGPPTSPSRRSGPRTRR